jgi:hypothetical protein
MLVALIASRWFDPLPLSSRDFSVLFLKKLRKAYPNFMIPVFTQRPQRESHAKGAEGEDSLALGFRTQRLAFGKVE